MMKGPEPLSCGARVRELGVFTLEKTRLWEETRVSSLPVAFPGLKGAYKKAGKGLCQGV